MSESLVIWIVDDEKDKALSAWTIVAGIAAGFRTNPVVLWADRFDWPPFGNFRASVDPTALLVEQGYYPTVVVLDLFDSGRNGFEFEGAGIYYQLRKWEVSKPGRPSFVVIWSPYQGQEDAKQFIASVRGNDPRLIILPTKSDAELKSCLEELWKRIVEDEDEL